MKLFQEVYRGRRVLITGNSGFKGSNLALMLTELGAELRGYSLSVPTEPALFKLLKLPGETVWGNILELPKLERTFADFLPEIVFHLAAQPLVRQSYLDPVETVNRYSAILKEKGCDLVIVLSHLGIEKSDFTDIMLAEASHDVDLIIGGHSHTFLEEPVYVKDADGDDVMIVTDGCWGLYVGKLEVE